MSLRRLVGYKALHSSGFQPGQSDSNTAEAEVHSERGGVEAMVYSKALTAPSITSGSSSGSDDETDPANTMVVDATARTNRPPGGAAGAHAETGTNAAALPASVPSGSRRRKTALELQQIFDVPCRPVYLDKKLGAGAFGTVYRGRLPSSRVVAIKQVAQDEHYCNHEAEICRLLAGGNHPNVVDVMGFYFTDDGRKRIMNLVMEYVPQSMRTVLSFLSRRDMRMKVSRVRIYMFQLARALLFLHHHNVLHRDIKPENILINPETHELKLADFGSAKCIVPGRKNVTYICSRFYRAPELILDRELYGPGVDVWAFGCILAEVAMGGPFFVGTDNVSQLVEIIRVLGSVTTADAEAMPALPGNTLGEFSFPHRAQKPWPQALTTSLPSGKRVRTSFGPSYESLLDSVLKWRPSNRFTAAQILAHPFFHELRASSGHQEVLPPQIFDSTDEERAAIGPTAQHVLGHILVGLPHGG